MSFVVRIVGASLVVAASVLPRTATAQACPPPEPVATNAEYIEWLDCTLVALREAWTEDILPAVQAAHPDAMELSGLRLMYVSDADFSPRLEDLDADGQLEVVFNTRLLIPQLAVSQAILWYLVAPDSMANPEDHLNYLHYELLPAVREDARRRSRDNAVGRFSVVGIPSMFHRRPDEHRTLLSLDTPHTRAIGDYVGALPTFFALIHEAGHAALHLDGVPRTVRDREREADAFAADVLAASDVPTTLGLAYLLLAYDLDRGGSSKEIACRVSELATRQDRGAVFELGPRAARRLEALRKQYLKHYSKLCP